MEWSIKRKDYFKNNVHLILSGGGSLGLFHIGIVKKLYELDMLPNNIHGSSVGSIIASIVCTQTFEEMNLFFKDIEHIYIDFFDTSWWYSIIHFVSKRNIHTGEKLILRMRELIGDITFSEAYQKTGRQLNITVADIASKKGLVINHKNHPNAVIWSAVSCSTALPGFFPDRHIYIKHNDRLIPLPDRFNDGAIYMDIPHISAKLKIISITNPLLITLNYIYRYRYCKQIVQYIIILLKRINIHQHWIVMMIVSMLNSHWDFKYSYYLPIHCLLFLPVMMFNPPIFLWKRWIQYGYNTICEKSLNNMIHKISEVSLYKEDIPE